MGARGKLISKGKGASLGGDIYELPVDESQPFCSYYDSKTGKVYPRLPADEYSQKLYRKRGLLPGLPPKNMEFSEIDEEPEVEGSGELLSLLKAMQQEIKDLKIQLSANKGETPPEEPVQLKLLMD